MSSKAKPKGKKKKQHCVKCGADSIEIWYCDNGACEIIKGREDFSGDHLHRRCRACGYEWPEHCKDDDRYKNT